MYEKKGFKNLLEIVFPGEVGQMRCGWTLFSFFWLDIPKIVLMEGNPMNQLG